MQVPSNAELTLVAHAKAVSSRASSMETSVGAKVKLAISIEGRAESSSDLFNPRDTLASVIESLVSSGKMDEVSASIQTILPLN